MPSTWGWAVSLTDTVSPVRRGRPISVLLQEPSVAVTGAAVSPRVTSIDIFRGLTMALMIFVNELSSIKGLPWWNYHMPENANGMTYVDMVFPAFLFILGMSVPLAVEQRLKKGASMGQL
jgi:heparan-alpha-glucosaminide N-acetyltransferase